MLNFNISKVAYFHEPLIIQTTETIPSSSKCHSAISGLTLPLPAWADVWMSQLNFPFNISFFYQYWYKRSVLRLFKTDYGDSLSAERISPEQRWCSGKLSACLRWYTYCQVSTIFASEFRRKKVGVKKILSITYSFNPLSPNIHIQILQTDVHTSPLRISWENLIKDHGIFSLVIILLILITLSLDNVWILLGENCCWSLLGLKKLK